MTHGYIHVIGTVDFNGCVSGVTCFRQIGRPFAALLAEARAHGDVIDLTDAVEFDGSEESLLFRKVLSREPVRLGARQDQP